MDLLEKFKSVWPVTYTGVTEDKKSNERIISEIPLHSIKPSPYQPRRVFDTDTIEELGRSIKKYGVIQPITVRKLADDSYELIAGERRLRACRVCGMLKVPAMVIDLGDNDSAVVALVENIQRENLSFMEEAEAYRNLLYHHGFTQEELAHKIGKSQSAVANKIRLLKLPLIVREIIRDNNLSERHARALLRLADEDEQLTVLGQITENKLNVSQSEELIDEFIKQKNAQPVMDEVKEIAENHLRCNESVRAEKKKIKLISKSSIRDVRLFLNTVRHAVDVMKQSGIEAQSTESEYDEYYEYTIRIPKNRNIGFQSGVK